MAKKSKKRRTQKRKVSTPSECYYTKTGTIPDYKEVLTLRRFISDRGKIQPQKRTGLSAQNQRLVSKAIKQARYMSLLPYTDKHSI